MFCFPDERNSETDSQTNEDSSDTQLSSGVNIGSLNHTTVHGSLESITGKPAGKQHTNGNAEKSGAFTKQGSSLKTSNTGQLQKQFGSDSKMLSSFGLDSRPGTPKDKDSGLSLMKTEGSAVKHKLTSSSSSRKSSNKKARHR